MTKQQLKGFSLIELIIAAAIIGILSVIAIPSYQNYIMESRRTDAYAALSFAAAEQERVFSYDSRYTANIDDLGGAETPEGFYTISVTATDTTFTLTATAKSSGLQFSDTDCRTLTIDHFGKKESANKVGTPSTNCW